MKTTLPIRILLLPLLLLLLCCQTLRAADYENPESLPDPMKGGRPMFVCNPDGFLSVQEASALNSRLLAMEQSVTVEMAVIVVNSIGDADPVQYAVDVSTLWGVGKASNSNGVVLLVAMESHDIALVVGYGLEGVLPDIVCDHIVDNEMVPLMREDKLYEALTVAVEQVNSIVSDPKVAEEVRGQVADRLKKETEENREALMGLVGGIACAMFVVSVILYIYAWRKSRKFGADWVERSKEWRKNLTWLLVSGILSLGTGLIFWLLAYWRYRYWRTRRRKCLRCGHKMKRLGEEEDNAYLNSGQDLEERLGTVDYDVWLCPNCGEVESFAFPSAQKTFTACPRCGTVAYGVDHERLVKAPTPVSKGLMERVYRCRHCGYTHTDNINVDNTGGGGGGAGQTALGVLGGIALGAALGNRNGGGGGGFGGGGWGGGSFGGGGASGRW